MQNDLYHTHKREASRRYYKSITNDQKRDIQFRHKFGLSIIDFYKLIEQQGSRCKICYTFLDTTIFGQKIFAVDHNHATGKVRGILCRSCNLMLGHAKDNIKILDQAIQYLRGTDDTS